MLAAALCMAACGFLLPRPPRPAARRLSSLVQTSRPHPANEGAARATSHDLRTRRVAAALAGIVCAITFGGPVGLVAGILVALMVDRSFGRSERSERRRRTARMVVDLPVAVDLLAACLRGGSPWGEAVEAVGTTVGGPLGEELLSVVVQIRLGVDPAVAWLALAKEPALAPLARTAVRAASSGTALAPSLARLASDQRRVARTAAAARARAAGVRAVAPLGLCFLPAFMLLGVVPAIAGIASTILLPW
ncbi:type II secretion system F family protein [Actinomadura rudentiformis]|uniref:Type II secretion system F family protein n=2 Tax=Actinomadura rudentiformis TaxID=359158 RepID=A0A6H9YVP2_9ACTN|nr:type II secretion system F family protein [Actinomadura rudentiformis]